MQIKENQKKTKILPDGAIKKRSIEVSMNTKNETCQHEYVHVGTLHLHGQDVRSDFKCSNCRKPLSLPTRDCLVVEGKLQAYGTGGKV